MELKQKKPKFKFEESDEKYMEKLRKLNARQYEVLRLSTNVTYDYAHIAAQLWLPVGSVKSALNRARAKIIKWRGDDALKATLDKIDNDFTKALDIMDKFAPPEGWGSRDD